MPVCKREAGGEGCGVWLRSSIVPYSWLAVDAAERERESNRGYYAHTTSARVCVCGTESGKGRGGGESEAVGRNSATSSPIPFSQVTRDPCTPTYIHTHAQNYTHVHARTHKCPRIEKRGGWEQDRGSSTHTERERERRSLLDQHACLIALPHAALEVFAVLQHAADNVLAPRRVVGALGQRVQRRYPSTAGD